MKIDHNTLIENFGAKQILEHQVTETGVLTIVAMYVNSDTGFDMQFEYSIFIASDWKFQNYVDTKTGQDDYSPEYFVNNDLDNSDFSDLFWLYENEFTLSEK